jgi:hypothetical protein
MSPYDGDQFLSLQESSSMLRSKEDGAVTLIIGYKEVFAVSASFIIGNRV